MKKLLIAVLVLIPVASCSSVNPADVASVKEADAAMVTGCKFLGTVDSVGMVQTELSTDKFIQRVRNGAKLKVKNLGGDTIVFSDSMTVKPVLISGKAYRCAQ